MFFFGDIDTWWKANNSKPTFDYFDTLKQNSEDYELFVFTGDMAYDLESDDCLRGDYFIRNLSTITSNWPIMVTGGNHDAGNNTQFSLFNGLFYKA